MKRSLSAGFLLCMLLTVGCHHNGCVLPHQGIDALRKAVCGEIQEAVANGNLPDPEARTFLSEAGFEKEWRERTVRWHRQLQELAEKAQREDRQAIADRAGELDALVVQLPESGERYRTRKLHTLAQRCERLMSAQ